MSLRLLKIVLRTAIAVLACGVFAAIGDAVWRPVEPLAPEASKPIDARVETAADERRELPSLDDFARVWSRLLRRPLYDPPPAAPAVAAAEKRLPLDVRLVGTIVEQGRSVAVFKTSKGELELKSEGERLGPNALGAEVLQVSAEVVVLRHQGEKIELKLPREGGE